MQKITLLYLAYFCLSGCVSVQLSPSKILKAKDINLNAPEKPFEKIDSNQVDQAWQSKKTGNTIAYLSECRDDKDEPLTSTEAEALKSLNQVKIISSQAGSYNDRESLYTNATGFVDGVAVETHLLHFKKNGCLYSLMYLGRQKLLKSEINYFEKFKEGFKAP